MLKATLRGAVLLGLVAVTMPAWAETQNVTVGGQTNVRSFFRQSMRLSNDVITAFTGALDGTSDYGSATDNFVQQLTAINVGADLTENVSAQTRLINQRVWGALPGGIPSDGSSNTDANQVEIGLANVKLREAFYSPLDVTIGRQQLWFGRGFIVGSRLLEGDGDPNDALAADEFTDHTAFDAIRGTIDLNGAAPMGMPLVIDLVAARLNESDVSVTNEDSSADDTNLLGVNVGTKFDSMSGEAEAYFWKKQNNDLNSGDGTIDNNPQANTIGIRGSAAPSEGLSVWSEVAYQWGNRLTTAVATDSEGTAGDDYQAWAANLGADFTFADAPWAPKVGAEWIAFSGDQGNATAIGGWDPVYRGAYTTALREFQGAGFYVPAQSGATEPGTTAFNVITNSATNQHQLALHATVWPIEDLSVDNRYTWFLADVGIVPTVGAKRESNFGGEWDVVANYNYTDDVTFGFIYALFSPGSVFRTPYDEQAQEIITSVDVRF